MGLWSAVLLPSQKQRERGNGLAGVPLPSFFLRCSLARSLPISIRAAVAAAVALLLLLRLLMCFAWQPPLPIPLLLCPPPLSPLSRFALSSTLALQRDQGKSGVAGSGGPSPPKGA